MNLDEKIFKTVKKLEVENKISVFLMKDELTEENMITVDDKKFYIGINRDLERIEIFDEDKELVMIIFI